MSRRAKPFWRSIGLVCASVALVGCAGTVIVDEPGAGRPGRGHNEVRIPKGHYPPPGSCRIWIPGIPPGQQSPPGDCNDLRRRVPEGAVLVRG